MPWLVMSLTVSACSIAYLSEPVGVQELDLIDPRGGETISGPIVVRFNLEISGNDTAEVVLGEQDTLPASWSRGDYSGDGTITFNPGGGARTLHLFLSAQVRSSDGAPSTRRLEFAVEWSPDPRARFITESLGGNVALVQTDAMGQDVPVSGLVTFRTEAAGAGEIGAMSVTVNGVSIGDIDEPPFEVQWPSQEHQPGTDTVEMVVTDVQGFSTTMSWTVTHDNCLLPDPTFDRGHVGTNGPDTWLDLVFDGAGSAYLLWDDDVGGGVALQSMSRVHPSWFGAEGIDFLEIAGGREQDVWILTTTLDGGRWLGHAIDDGAPVATIDRKVVLDASTRDLHTDEEGRPSFLRTVDGEVHLWRLGKGDLPVIATELPLDPSSRFIGIRNQTAYIVQDTQLIRLKLDGNGDASSQHTTSLASELKSADPGLRFEPYKTRWMVVGPDAANFWNLELNTLRDPIDTQGQAGTSGVPTTLIWSQRAPQCDVLIGVEDDAVRLLDLR